MSGMGIVAADQKNTLPLPALEFKERSQTEQQNGWNCFDLAVGLNREALVRFALHESKQENFRQLLAPEIRHAAALTVIYMNRHSGAEEKARTDRLIDLFHIMIALNGEGEQIDIMGAIVKLFNEQTHADENRLARAGLPASMRTPELQRLVNDYETAYESMQETVASCNEALGYAEGKRQSLERLDQFFADPAKQTECRVAYEIFKTRRDTLFTPFEKAFNDYCLQQDTYECYVKDYYGEQGWFAFQKGFSGEQAHSMVDIAARFLNVKIILYEKKGEGAYKEIYCTTALKGRKTLHVLFRNNNHFVGLDPVPIAASRANTHEISQATLQYWSTKEALKYFDRHPEALFWCKQMAAQGHAPAQYKLGRLYLKNEQVEGVCLSYGERHQMAISLYQSAAIQDYAPAQCRLGTLHRLNAIYIDGRPVSKEELSDEDRDRIAVSWYKKAAAQNYAPAFYGLGVLYINKRVSEKLSLSDEDRDRTAVSWYKKAAAQDYAPALYDLGMLYINNRVPDVPDLADDVTPSTSLAWSVSLSIDSSGKLFVQQPRVNKAALLLGTLHLRRAAKQGHTAASRELARLTINYHSDREAYYHQAIGLGKSLYDLMYSNSCTYISKYKARTNNSYLTLFLQDQLLDEATKRSMLKAFPKKNWKRLLPETIIDKEREDVINKQNQRLQHYFYELLFRIAEECTDPAERAAFTTPDMIPSDILDALKTAQGHQLADVIEVARTRLWTLRTRYDLDAATLDVLDKLDTLFIGAAKLDTTAMTAREHLQSTIDHYRLLLTFEKVQALPLDVYTELQAIAAFLQTKQDSLVSTEDTIKGTSLEFFRSLFSARVSSMWAAGEVLYSDHVEYHDHERAKRDLAIKVTATALKAIPLVEKFGHLIDLGSLCVDIYKGLRTATEIAEYMLGGLEKLDMLHEGLSVLHGFIVDMPTRLKKLYFNLGPLEAKDLIDVMAWALSARYQTAIEALTSGSDVMTFAEDTAQCVLKYLMNVKLTPPDDSKKPIPRDSEQLTEDILSWCRHCSGEGQKLKSISSDSEIIRSGDLLARTALVCDYRATPDEEKCTTLSLGLPTRPVRPKPAPGRLTRMKEALLGKTESKATVALAPHYGTARATPREVFYFNTHRQSLQLSLATVSVADQKALPAEAPPGLTLIFSIDVLQQHQHCTGSFHSTLTLSLPIHRRVAHLEENQAESKATLQAHTTVIHALQKEMLKKADKADSPSAPDPSVEPLKAITDELKTVKGEMECLKDEIDAVKDELKTTKDELKTAKGENKQLKIINFILTTLQSNGIVIPLELMNEAPGANADNEAPDADEILAEAELAAPVSEQSSTTHIANLASLESKTDREADISSPVSATASSSTALISSALGTAPSFLVSAAFNAPFTQATKTLVSNPSFITALPVLARTAGEEILDEADREEDSACCAIYHSTNNQP